MSLLQTRGKFITFEGIDGAGKTSHLFSCCSFLKNYLKNTNRSIITTREPGGTYLAETLRNLIINYSMHIKTKTLLIFSARCEHISQVITPALERGDWVLCDRFTDSTFAYQSGGYGLTADYLTVLEKWIQDTLQPDLTLFLDVSPIIAAQRKICMKTSYKDCFESESLEFFERVRNEYFRRAKEERNRVKIIDASRNFHLVRNDIYLALQKYLSLA